MFLSVCAWAFSPLCQRAKEADIDPKQQSGRYVPTNRALKERARAARRWLKARPEKEIVMVTHGGYLHYFTEDWEDSSQYQGM